MQATTQKHEVVQTVEIARNAADVWKKVRDFARMDWHPAVESIDTNGGNEPGNVRTINLKGGGRLLEKLDAHSDSARSFTYRMLDTGPLPISDYRSTLTVTTTGADKCTVTWLGTFGSTTDAAAAVEIVTGIYRAGLDHLKEESKR